MVSFDDLTGLLILFPSLCSFQEYCDAVADSRLRLDFNSVEFESGSYKSMIDEIDRVVSG